MSVSVRRIVTRAAVVLGVLGLVIGGLLLTEAGRRLLVGWLDTGYSVQGDPSDLRPRFEGADAERRRIDVRLVVAAEGFDHPTDMQPVPGHPELVVVLEKKGVAWWLDLGAGTRGRFFEIDALTASEQGLLGLAFHPDFVNNGRLFTHHTGEADGADHSLVIAWRAQQSDPRKGEPRRGETLLSVAQPYPNHNAGQLAFGPDGKLYVGMGDGGFKDDPHGHGQNPDTLLGTMLRLDVDGDALVPADNPFVGRPGHRPEIWAYGLRNPWRYSFAPDGRLVVADVGQNTTEEITIVGRGENHGWALREGDHCFPSDSDCPPRPELVDPIYTYPRSEGQSITGGYVYTGDDVDALHGHYVFGDFVTGRLWAFELPPAGQAVQPERVYALGRFNLLPSAFGLDAQGRLYVVDYGTGRLLRIAPGA